MRSRDPFRELDDLTSRSSSLLGAAFGDLPGLPAH
jgi:hypothetical protein